MAKWQATSAEFTATGGSATSQQTAVMYIYNLVSPNGNPLDGGVYSGYNIQAKNFKVGLGKELVDNEWTPTAGVFFNADSQISKVKFIDMGTPGDPLNFVKVEVTVDAFTPSVATTLYVDIDENSAEHPIVPADGGDLNLYFEFRYRDPDHSSNNHTVTQSNLLSGFTSTTSVGSASHLEVNDISGVIQGIGVHDIAKYTFTAETGYHYPDSVLTAPPTQFLSSPNAGVLSQNLNAIVTNVVYTNSLITSFTLDIQFVHPMTPGLSLSEITDESLAGLLEVEMLTIELMNIRIIQYVNTIQDPIEDPETINHVAAVVHSTTATASGGSAFCHVFGYPGSPYQISFQKKTSVTSDVTAATGGYYNFATNQFQDNEYWLNSFVPTTGGAQSHNMILPPATSQTRFDFMFLPTVDGVTSSFDGSIPVDPGQASLIQQGVQTLTITPITNNAGNFGALPSNVTVTKSALYQNSGYVQNYKQDISLRGGTGGSSSTRLVLSKTYGSSYANILPGMIISCTGIAHNTTVSKIVDNVVTMSGANTIADNSYINFYDSRALTPFSFTITPNGNTLNVNTANEPISQVGGAKEFKTTVSSSAAKTNTHTLTSTQGIVPGMVAIGDGIGRHGGNGTVASITNATTIVFDDVQSLVSGDKIRFVNGNVRGQTELKSAKAEKVGSNIVISGYVRSSSVNETAQLRIYIDPLITVS
tara:strand:- start:6102 stop:8210 length:2109 start_codon:yes stop_codon:yes gene_type:complete